MSQQRWAGKASPGTVVTQDGHCSGNLPFYCLTRCVSVSWPVWGNNKWLWAGGVKGARKTAGLTGVRPDLEQTWPALHPTSPGHCGSPENLRGFHMFPSILGHCLCCSISSERDPVLPVTSVFSSAQWGWLYLSSQGCMWKGQIIIANISKVLDTLSINMVNAFYVLSHLILTTISKVETLTTPTIWSQKLRCRAVK